MAFNLDNYVDVPTRLAEALKRWPDLRIQETDNQVITMPDGSTFIRCTVTVWRDVADPIPVVASAAEPFPGNTPYTKRSEYMVGMTSALGRALGYMGCGVAKSIASRNEVEARLEGHEATITPMRNPLATTPPMASSKQIYMIKALAKGKELDDLKTLELLQHTLGVNDVIIETLTVAQASKVIEAWKL
jgi:hypothetical protein